MTWRGPIGALLAAAVAVACALACGASYDEDLGVADASAPDVAASDSGPPPLKCGDPGSQCVVAPPGWLVVSFGTLGEDAGAASCPPYFTEGRVLAENVRESASTCTCTCGASGNPCLGGSADVDVRTGGANCNDYKAAFILDGTCRALPGNWPNNANAVQAPPPTPGTTTCPVTNTLPARVNDGRASVCTSPPPAPCGEGACVAAPAEVTTCVLRDGDHECPAPYAKKQRVVDEKAVGDSRQCSSCTCVPRQPSCASPSLVFYQDTACGNGGTPGALTSACNVVQNIATAKAYRYTVTADAGCDPSAPSPAITGALTLPPAQTLCCR